MPRKLSIGFKNSNWPMTLLDLRIIYWHEAKDQVNEIMENCNEEGYYYQPARPENEDTRKLRLARSRHLLFKEQRYMYCILASFGRNSLLTISTI